LCSPAAGTDFCSGYDISGKGSPVRGPLLSAVMKSKYTGMEKVLKKTDYFAYNQAVTIRDVSKPTIGHGSRKKCIAAGLLYASICEPHRCLGGCPVHRSSHQVAHAGFEVLLEPYLYGFRKAKEVMWTGDHRFRSGGQGVRHGQ